MNAVLAILAGALLAALGWRWSLRSMDAAAKVALVAVLGVTAAAFNVIVPVPSIEATTTVVLCTAAALGPRLGAAAGVVAVVASSVAGGIGVWTPWQLVAVLVVAIVGGGLGAACAPGTDWFAARRRVALGAAAALATLAWDVVTTVGSVLSFAPAGGSPLALVTASLLVGAAFTATHVTFTTCFSVLGGPPLLHALERARPRLAGGTIEAAPAAVR